jgi:hypothetical protein
MRLLLLLPLGREGRRREGRAARPGVAVLRQGSQLGCQPSAPAPPLHPSRDHCSHAAAHTPPPRRRRGTICMDAGAVCALRDRRKSLFSAGITEVSGDFQSQDAVSLCSAAGVEFARGLVNFTVEVRRRGVMRRRRRLAGGRGGGGWRGSGSGEGRDVQPAVRTCRSPTCAPAHHAAPHHLRATPRQLAP